MLLHSTSRIAPACTKSSKVNSRALVDGKVTKLPVRVLESSRIVRDIRSAGPRTTLVIYARLTGPIAAQIDVHNDALVLEVVPNVAVGIWEVARCFAPQTRVWLAGVHVRGDGVTRKLPHSDASVAQLHGHDAAAGAVE